MTIIYQIISLERLRKIHRAMSHKIKGAFLVDALNAFKTLLICFDMDGKRFKTDIIFLDKTETIDVTYNDILQIDELTD